MRIRLEALERTSVYQEESKRIPGTTTRICGDTGGLRQRSKEERPWRRSLEEKSGEELFGRSLMWRGAPAGKSPLKQLS